MELQVTAPCHERPHAAPETQHITNRHEPLHRLAGPVPGPVSHQQRGVHRHQWPCRPASGARTLDGDLAGDGLCGGRRAFHATGGQEPGAAGAAGLVPAGPAGGAGVGGAVRAGGLLAALCAAVSVYSGGGLLQRQRPALPLCGGRIGGACAARQGHLAGAGGRADRCGAGPGPGQRHAHHVCHAVSGRLPGLDGGGGRIDGVDAPGALCTAVSGCRGWQRAAAHGGRAASATGVCGRHVGGCGQLRHHEPADGRHAAGHGCVRL
ncbi:hypothetical protein D3C72_1320970 [compost metagenome]